MIENINGKKEEQFSSKRLTKKLKLTQIICFIKLKDSNWYKA